MNTRKPKDPREGKVSGVTTGRGGSHDEIGGKNTRKGYKTSYTPKKGTALPKSGLSGKARKEKSSVMVNAEYGRSTEKETGKQTVKRSMTNKNVEKTKIKSAAGTKKIKTNLGTGKIDVKFKGKKFSEGKGKKK
jgi:hypothetical protein